MVMRVYKEGTRKDRPTSEHITFYCCKESPEVTPTPLHNLGILLSSLISLFVIVQILIQVTTSVDAVNLKFLIISIFLIAFREIVRSGSAKRNPLTAYTVLLFSPLFLLLRIRVDILTVSNVCLVPR